MQAEIQITNWRRGMLTFLPSGTMAEPSSPSRVRCAAPNPRRALDRSGQLCKISPLGRKVDLRKKKNKDKIKIYLTSTGILMEGINTTVRLKVARQAKGKRMLVLTRCFASHGLGCVSPCGSEARFFSSTMVLVHTRDTTDPALVGRAFSISLSEPIMLLSFQFVALSQGKPGGERLIRCA